LQLSGKKTSFITKQTSNRMSDFLLEDIIGKYYKKEIDKETGFGTEFFLEVEEAEEGRLKFVFEMDTLGEFGKIGETWRGTGISRGDHLLFVVQQQENWVQNGDERIGNEVEQQDILPIEAFPHFGKIVIYHKKINKLVTLDKKEED